MTIVRVADLRACNYCARGSRDFFSRNGLDWSRFVADGLPASELEKTGDAMALAVVEAARKREASE